MIEQGQIITRKRTQSEVIQVVCCLARLDVIVDRHASPATYHRSDSPSIRNGVKATRYNYIAHRMIRSLKKTPFTSITRSPTTVKLTSTASPSTRSIRRPAKDGIEERLRLSGTLKRLRQCSGGTVMPLSITISAARTLAVYPLVKQTTGWSDSIFRESRLS